MDQLNEKDISNLTNLSRIDCSETEKEHLLHDLRQIIDYMGQLQEVDTQNTQPTYHVLATIHCPMREDQATNTLDTDFFLESSPSQVNGQICVPPILKQS